MRRRDLLALAAAPALAGCRFDLREGFTNECRVDSRIANHPLVRAAWEGLHPGRVWDMHVHLFGNGRSTHEIHVEDGFHSPRSPAMAARRRFFMNAGCVGGYDEGTDARMVRRLALLADQLPAGAKVMLLAFDFPYDEEGKPRPDLATFAVRDGYAFRIAQSRRDRFEWLCSVHPYQPFAVQALEDARRWGARGVKWLPPSMGIDLASPRCRPFYEAARRLDMPLLIHVGEEQAAPGAGRHDLGNPLLLRYPLEAGVRVIAAHCATLGRAPDLDANANPDKAPLVSCFSLFERLMADRNHERLLSGDISAITQANRPGAVTAILRHEEWDGRLLNGSDYPLPGVLPLVSLGSLADEGVLDAALVPALREIRHANVLLFDFVLKRNLRLHGRGFTERTFHTAPAFAFRDPQGPIPGARPVP